MIEYPKGHLGILEIIRTGYVECVFGIKKIVKYESAVNFYYDVLEILDTSLSRDTPVDCLEIPKEYSESRWIYNLYLILHECSKEITQSGKKTVFINAIIAKQSLVCSNRIYSVINRIEKGLKVLDSFNLSNNTNLLLFVFYFKDLWFEILVLEFALRKKFNENFEELLRAIKIIKKDKIINKVETRSPLDTSILSSLLDIEPKFISYFAAESIIFKISQSEISNDDLVSYLKNNKGEIIARHSLFK
ncbi:tRNA adenilyl transferase [Nosema bombycis CQ1]|uniref:tRNA adenilyl transferase n=1 Tax=Nosema bombycis (strain CQ1 / CVCC 102059) TaxID=578461 RepID=R0M1S5_NOSB1|nr:tRNA adenilyl transferase [Nosema bombycis CQ1]|eukprot:EOB11969.1 tRNA adenilyl transferase [Nosema bombycis CQ1]